MSIATLKRKTQTKYNNMSVGEKQFSLNGTLRNQGYVGQTSLSRSLPRTLMKGNVAKGHGGCCGKFLQTPIVQSGLISLNDPTVVKSSVLGTQGMINTHYRWIKRGEPFSTVKPDTNNNLNTQDDYITRLKKNSIKEADDCNNNTEIQCNTTSKSCFNYNPYFRQKVFHFTKPENSYKPISSSDYITKLHDGCTVNDVIIITNTNKTPFACG
jgi:hypothetical protein